MDGPLLCRGHFSCISQEFGSHCPSPWLFFSALVERRTSQYESEQTCRRQEAAGAIQKCKRRGLYIAFVMPTMLSMFSTRAFAADTIWTKASAIMQDVYTQILSISTIAAVVTAAVALLLMNFSRSGRTVDESRAWLKRIIITWAILNSLGFIMAYVTPFFAGGTWTP